MLSSLSKHGLIFLIYQIVTMFQTCCLSSSSKTVKMEIEKIIPDVIPIVPKEVLQVTYNDLQVQLGNELTPTQVKNQPIVHWNAEPGAFYTLSMTDPDTSSRQNATFREVKHWLVGNIPGVDVSKEDTLAEYRGSGPPKNTALHRYVFLVYKKPEKFNFDEPRVHSRSREGRLGFKITKFADKYDLGNSIAGNFYVAQYDDYVSVLQKKRYRNVSVFLSHTWK